MAVEKSTIIVDGKEYSAIQVLLGGNEKFKELVDGSVTEITAEDLEGVSEIRKYAFMDCNALTSFALPDSVTTIREDGLYGMVVENLIIPDSVLSIGNYGCSRCSSKTIDIGTGITSIGTNAFYKCDQLTSFTIRAITPPILQSSAFSNTNNCPIYVPAESVTAYKTATNWTSLASRIQAISE